MNRIAEEKTQKIKIKRSEEEIDEVKRLINVTALTQETLNGENNKNKTEKNKIAELFKRLKFFVEW